VRGRNLAVPVLSFWRRWAPRWRRKPTREGALMPELEAARAAGDTRRIGRASEALYRERFDALRSKLSKLGGGRERGSDRRL